MRKTLYRQGMPCLSLVLIAMRKTPKMIDLTPIWISLKTAITATIITFVLGIIIARGMLEYRGKGKGIIEAFLTAPLVLPPTVVGFLLLLLFGKNGFLGQILGLFGIRIVFSWYATVIAAVVVSFPLMYKTALGAFQQIDRSLIACARTLGASEWTIFWRIIFPLAKPGIMAATLLAFARALGEFGATLMLAGSIPGKTQTIPIAIFFAAESGAIDQALVLVIVMLAISLGVITTVNYWSEYNGYSPTKIRRSDWLITLFKLDRLITRKKQLGLNNLFPKNRFLAKTELIVDITKQLTDFCLEVSFTSDRTALGLLGASGAGKSTILRCIAGLETPDRGKIILNGRTLFDSEQNINLPPRDRACGFLFQNYALFPHLTVAENIAFGIKSNQSYRIIKQYVEKHLVAVDLRSKSNCYPHQLSGGQQQRVALARAKASQPEILLLDEPFSALDTHLRDQQAQLLRENLVHYQGITLFITHNLEEVYRICPNLLVIDQGKAIAHDTKKAIFEHPPNIRVAQLTGYKNFSRTEIIDNHTIRAIDWDCSLTINQPYSSSLNSIGIRPHQLSFLATDKTENTFLCWLATLSETQHSITLYLKLNQPPHNSRDYHLQAEILKDQWLKIKDRAFPWYVCLNNIQYFSTQAAN